MTAEVTAAQAENGSTSKVRTAVVVVHGMGE
ncbi:MAG: hypothetical protein V7643_412 [Mycobacterium sp.]|jgi:hypothetical protein